MAVLCRLALANVDDEKIIESEDCLEKIKGYKKRLAGIDIQINCDRNRARWGFVDIR